MAVCPRGLCGVTWCDIQHDGHNVTWTGPGALFTKQYDVLPVDLTNSVAAIHIDRLVQGRRNSSALVMELRLS